jgi:hypothetical protein
LERSRFSEEKREKERVTPEFGEGKEEKILPPNSGRYSQEDARRAEGNWKDSKAIHNIDEAEAHQQYKHKRDKAASADQP